MSCRGPDDRFYWRAGASRQAEGMTTNTGSMKKNFGPLLADVAVPIGSYYLLKSGFGMGTVAALGWSSVVPAVRTVWGLSPSGRSMPSPR